MQSEHFSWYNIFMILMILFLFGGYCAMLAALYFRQRKLIYHPDTNIADPAHYGLDHFTEHRAATSDGETVQLWHHPANAHFPTIVYYHGNATHMGTRAPLYRALAAKGFGVLALSYRGYGKSTGQPSEAGLYNDARAAIAYLINEKHIAIERIMIYGESLGTGVAVQMAVEYKVAALILQAPYTSISARAAEVYYYVPVKYLIKDKFHSLAKIADVKAPLLIFHGERDEVIPIKHGRALLAAATAPKQNVFFPTNGHNDFDTTVISEHVLRFAETYKIIW